MWGYSEFKKTEQGWKCVLLDKDVEASLKQGISTSYKNGKFKVLQIYGKFHTYPQVGYFCKRPHKYMELT